jgi:hypothetical protein
MRLSALRPIPGFLAAASCAAFLALVSLSAGAQDDPPAQAGRISYISGNVSVQPVGSDDWGQAYPNLPVGPGDRIFTDSNGRAEIQVGQTYVRIGPNSDVSLVDDSQFGINFGVAQGSIRLKSFGLWDRQLLDISTPNGNAEFANHGDMRVDVMPADGATIFTNLGDFADVTAAGDYRQELDAGQALELAGSNPVYPEWLQTAEPDDLDYWSQQRDQMLSRVRSFQYVSPDIPGAADLDQYGDWQGQSDYGAIWFPREVPAGWSPYHYGHWVNHDPWGWVWVEDEPWGYAPFHYGRWVSYGGRWGWVPGAPNVRPVWSPALVVFAGGIHFGGGGGGISVWFPLGPGEAYRPWYHCSPRYIDQVNITNIRESPRVHVQTTYVNVVNVTNVTNITYINQTSGATAMRQEDFAAGRSAHDVAVRVDPQQLQHIQPLARPEAVPTKQSIVTRPVVQPVRVSAQRPNLINQQGKMIAARPGATPVAPPVRSAPPVRPLPGRVVIAQPPHPAPGTPGARPIPPAQGGQNLRSNPSSPTLPPGQRPQPLPVAPTQGIPRPIAPLQNNQQNNQYQPPPNNPNGQQTNRQPVNPRVQPGVQQPVDRPTPPPQTNQPPTYNPPPNRPAPPQPQERPAPTPPANHPPQERPAPPPPQERPAPPPPQTHPAPPPPQQQAKPAPQNKNNKDEKKNENKKPE